MKQPVETIIAAHLEALGGQKTADSVQSIHAIASCTSPQGNYVTEIYSAREQRLHFRQTWSKQPPFIATINKRNAWATDARTGDVQALADSSVAMLRSHEFQMIPLTLKERFTQLAVGPPTSFAGKACATLQASDELANPCTLYFSTQTGLLAGFIMTNPVGKDGETVQIIINRWQKVDGVNLPTNVTATDANGDFVLDFHTVTVNQVEDTLFAVPSDFTGEEAQS